MTRNVSIYALFNPITNLIFYVGATCNMKARFSSHLGERYLRNSYKSLQIREIMDSGYAVEMILLEDINGDEYQVRELEEFYINLLKFYGFPLKQLNVSSYGRPAIPMERTPICKKRVMKSCTIFEMTWVVRGINYVISEEVKLGEHFSEIEVWDKIESKYLTYKCTANG